MLSCSKRFLAVACSLVLVATMASIAGVAAPQQAQAAGKVSISAKTATVKVGKVKKLKLRNATPSKVKWKSSKKSVATVSAKGVVKGKRKGAAVISAKYKGKTYKCRVKVVRSAAKASTASGKLGSRRNPYVMNKGASIKMYDGTAYAKVQKVYRGNDAKTLAKKLGAYDTESDEYPGNELVLIKLYIKAQKGFEDYSLRGSRFDVSSSEVFNASITNRMKNVGSCNLWSNELYDIELYNGGHDSGYIALFLPKGTKAFCTQVLGKSGCVWVRYNL